MGEIAAVLIAAGESTRIGHLKPLLPWDGRTLIRFQIQALSDAGVSEIVVVLGHAAVEVAPHVRGAATIKMLINPQYTQGKSTSIKLGLREVDRHATGLLLLAVDQPRPSALLRHIIGEHEEKEARITQPVHQGKGGHPLLFHSSLLPELLGISEEGLGVREVMEREPTRIHRVPVASPIVLLDINTEEDYQQALRLFRQRAE